MEQLQTVKTVPTELFGAEQNGAEQRNIFIYLIKQDLTVSRQRNRAEQLP